MDNSQINVDAIDMGNFSQKIGALESELATVTTVMKRVDGGSYGKCDSCGEEIDLELLSKNPKQLFCAIHSPSPISML